MKSLFGVFAAVLAVGCFRRGDVPLPVPSAIAARANQATIERHTRELASDRYEGRFPGTRGETLAVAYIEQEMRRLGLAPGNPDGSYAQQFDLVAQRDQAAGHLIIAGQRVALSIPNDAAFAATGGAPRTSLEDSPLLFVGYGIAAPEYGWDDYAGVDVRGKTVLVMGGEPTLRSTSDTTQLDTTFFAGKRLTAHGTEERKREVARAHGAAAMIVITRGGLGTFRQWIELSRGEFLSLGNEEWPGVFGFFRPAFASALFAAAGRDLTRDSLAANRRGFRAVPLDGTLDLDLTTQWRRIPTRNVVARLPGSDRSLREEAVIFTAHWDAYGIGPAVDGDSIYNGAVDNAVGVGQLLAVAEALASSNVRPRRTVLFVATSSEENGPLLGAKHYVAHPLVPLDRTVAAINFDVVNLAGATRDVTLLGAGRSTLDALVAEAAQQQGRVAMEERATDSNAWFRLDHSPFAAAGVPGVSVAAGNDVAGKPAGYAEQRALEYRTRHYHRPSDEVRDDWDWGSIVQDAQLGVLLGLRLANGADRPVWTTRTEFADGKRKP